MNRFVVHLELILEEMYLFILEKEQNVSCQSNVNTMALVMTLCYI
jgi:hypothetical protein